MKDTVAADEEDDEVHADDDAERVDPAVRLNTVVHDHIPVFTRQYLPITQPHMMSSIHQQASVNTTRSHPEMVGDMSRVTLNFDLSKIPSVRF